MVQEHCIEAYCTSTVFGICPFKTIYLYQQEETLDAILFYTHWLHLVGPWSQSAPSHQFPASLAVAPQYPGWSGGSLGMYWAASHSGMPSLEYKEKNEGKVDKKLRGENITCRHVHVHCGCYHASWIKKETEDRERRGGTSLQVIMNFAKATRCDALLKHKEQRASVLTQGRSCTYMYSVPSTTWKPTDMSYSVHSFTMKNKRVHVYNVNVAAASVPV